jgi:hypothetical protein
MTASGLRSSSNDSTTRRSTSATTVDRVQLRALLRSYLQMSARGVALLRNRGGMPTSLAYVLVLYALMGAMLGAMAFFRTGMILLVLTLDWMTFLVVGMAAVVEANDVLFDPKEEEVLLHRPIHPSTLLAAKALALVGFTSMLAGALNLVPTFFGLAAKGVKPWFPLVHVASTALLVVCACAMVVCTYGLVLRVFGRERFEHFAVYAQTLLVLVFFGATQLGPRLLPMDGGPIVPSPLMLALPPTWFAMIDATLAGDVTAPAARVCAVAAVVVTAVLSWIAVGKLSSGYADVAPIRAIVGTPESASSLERDADWGSFGRSSPITRLWLRDPIERGAFRLAAAYVRRNREIKMRLYPQFAMFIALTAMQFTGARSSSTLATIMMLAIAGTLPVTVIDALRMSSDHAAADLFRYAPLENAASLFHGVRKASIAIVQLPVMALIAALMIAMHTDQSTLELTLPLALVIPTLSLIPGAFGTFLPLSQPPRRGEQSSRNVGIATLMMFLVCVPIGLAWAARELGVYWPMVAVEIVGIVLAHRWLLRAIRNRPMVYAME